MKGLLIVFLTALVILFMSLSRERRSWLQTIGLLGLLAALGVMLGDLLSGDAGGLNTQFASMMVFDDYALSFSAVALVGAILIVGLSGWGFRQLDETLGDNYGLILFSLCGAFCMFAFTNAVMLFIGIEILSIPLYVLAGSRRNDPAGNEAALKYFLMGAFASGILLFGLTFVYGATGSFEMARIAESVASGRVNTALLFPGVLFVLAGMSFKVSAAPFHFWAPDVYQGSPNLVTAYMATVVKVAGFAAFYRLFSTAFAGVEELWAPGVAAIAALTMTLANLTAIFQQDFKRMLAYSSISHAGYLLLGILAIGQSGASGAILLYALTYTAASVAAFACYIVVAEPNADGSINAFRNLSRTQPLIAAVMAIAMLSLAGIPPLPGFFGKYFLFAAAFQKYPWLVVLAVVNSAISIYYYFKVIIAMYFGRADEEGHPVELPASISRVMALALLLLIALMVAPGLVYGLLV
ncbi:MAG: NADH-quinone oxidoreductase subunit N [Saprospiraceae bacterium]